MKTNIFIDAIRSRSNLKFLYCSNEITLEPYYITRDRTGKKVIYGRIKSSNEIKKFEYKRIANIRVLSSYSFSPRIPLATKVV
ncbi:MAG: hypothetical protein KJN64_11160 [Ignavibacteria bacterium]|nr:hypothetical protein [Ignavibacteria bacterium]MBT8380778.1 hypothetical protein [Ignavibacteria bacterium]MBT8392873.1 hypothetical protein [Ignavibacteria bacterium]NNJ53227.1 hypothetical protein [Ignavibacteriaceae bacterium]NNL19713.1 hypothetical protein [Ignavibacteriaceae bacterium]